MHPTIISQIAAQRIAGWHQQAARQRLVGQLRAVGSARPRNSAVLADWTRLSVQRSRPAAA